MKKVLITGGAGFIGLHLARSLVSDGVAVDLIDNFARGENDDGVARLCSYPNVRLIPLDLSVTGATDEIDDDYDEIFHFAAIVGVANVIARAYDTLVLNVALTREALRLSSRQKNLTSFVFSSTSEIYDGSLLAGILQFPTPEDSIIALPPLTQARTSYMLSKVYGEAMVHHADVPGVIVRPYNIFGPRMGDEHVIPELMKRMRAAPAGSDLEIFSSDHRRTFCYIDDAFELIKRLAADSRAVGQAWNVGNESPEYEIREVAEMVLRTVGADLNLVPGEQTTGSPSRRCPSMTRTKALTGFEPRVSLQDGIERTYRWYSKYFS